MKLIEILSGVHPIFRIVIIIFIGIAAHFAVKAIRRLSKFMLTMKVDSQDPIEASLSRRYPKVATIITILVSAGTFSIYFLCVGLILREFHISLTTYFASATVIGLAVGFGLQGFVQDVVIGLTLIFTDALNIGEVVELGDKIGRVDVIGLRFTKIINLHGQRILIPNRNINIISKFRGNCIRAYADIQLPHGIDEKEISSSIHAIANGMFRQHQAIILDPPEMFGIREVPDGKWRYLRVKFKLWPGQMTIINETFKERALYLLKIFFPDYASWMITVTHKVE
jgi:small conductance mechanosensitive channel